MNVSLADCINQHVNVQRTSINFRNPLISIFKDHIQNAKACHCTKRHGGNSRVDPDADLPLLQADVQIDFAPPQTQRLAFTSTLSTEWAIVINSPLSSLQPSLLLCETDAEAECSCWKPIHGYCSLQAFLPNFTQASYHSKSSFDPIPRCRIVDPIVRNLVALYSSCSSLHVLVSIAYFYLAISRCIISTIFYKNYVIIHIFYDCDLKNSALSCR